MIEQLLLTLGAAPLWVATAFASEVGRADISGESYYIRVSVCSGDRSRDCSLTERLYVDKVILGQQLSGPGKADIATNLFVEISHAGTASAKSILAGVYGGGGKVTLGSCDEDGRSWDLDIFSEDPIGFQMEIETTIDNAISISDIMCRDAGTQGRRDAGT